ncbi:unnamed protein product [Ceutorhynchus assimilis]|uniref:Uncharacterized protein n=1 Tax=Ceutorhynchus assimilis TaxID=467358 RepID=A0A9N9MNB0_9CUCU|nr:unnamed protein product [Ceutorhynchus assimilis]
MIFKIQLANKSKYAKINEGATYADVVELDNCILKIGGIYNEKFSSSDSTLSINSDTPLGSEVVEWLNKNTDKPNEDTQNVVVLNIDNDGFLIPQTTDKNTEKVELNQLNDEFFSNTEYENGQMLKEYLLNNGGGYIFEEYAKNQILTNRTRKELVNLTVRMMLRRFGTTMSKQEVFYNDTLKSPSGYLAWRLRTVVRNLPSTSKKRKLSTIVEINDEDQNRKKLRHTITKSEEADIEFLKNACPKTQKHEIFEKMANTFKCRKDQDFSLNDIPTFLDTPGLIEQDFNFLHPEAKKFTEQFRNNVNKILAIYDATVSNKHLHIEAWEKNTKALLSVVHMLPSTAKGRKSKNYSRDNVSCLFQKLIVFLSVGKPLQEILEANKGSQPYLIAIGSKESAIHDYKVVVDNRCLDTGFTTILEAFDFLFKVHFVFKISYEVGLETFYSFIQSFFYNIDVSKINYTAKMRELKNRLVNFEG